MGPSYEDFHVIFITFMKKRYLSYHHSNDDPDDSIVKVSDRAFNDRRYFIDCSKLLALGWVQQKSWEQGIAETVAWYTDRDLTSFWGNFDSALRPHPVLTASPSTGGIRM